NRIQPGVWYTGDVLTTLQQLIRRVMARTPYPPALQSLISLVVLATLPGTLTNAGSALTPRFALVCVLVALDLAMCWCVPARNLRRWQQFAYLFVQLGIVSLAHAMLPSQVLGYVFLVIVLQAVYLFKPLLWAMFAACAYLIWNGWLMLASASLIDWLHGNLALAFPMLCILIAAIVYARQHQRSEQVQQVFQQMQRRYDSLKLVLRDAQQSAALEERHRLAETISHDISAALAQVEQGIANAISQAETSLPRFETTVAQTRATATAAIERLRGAVATLRLGAHDERAARPQPAGLALPPDELMTAGSLRALTWCLPLAFAAIALPLAQLQHPVTPALAGLFVLGCTALVGGYVFTQRMRNPLLVQLGLAGQAIAVLGIAFATQALPLMLGLLLVIWQIAMRLSAGQIVAFLVGLQTVIGLTLTRVLPVAPSDPALLLILGVACAAVIGLVGPARRQLNHRRQVAARLAQLTRLTNELEQQVAQVRALGVAVERTRIAREIHDDLGHRLVLLNVQLQLVDDLIAEDPAAALDQLCWTREQLREAWSSVLGTADLALALDGVALVPALGWLVEQCRALTSIRITLRIIGDLTDLDSAVACTIYRAVQEGLTNMCKYARARHADILVSYDDVFVQVRVRDDGHGSEAAVATHIVPGAAGHFGLVGLRERAELLGGSARAGPLPEGGFELSLTIPIR
ncbi:MAG TPA: histidine kinase, partial [Roseiflexaceae bacterium]|nr:histidine kinase [Roseiflexaceae bacterium]